jgi:hypothetical protein
MLGRIPATDAYSLPRDHHFLFKLTKCSHAIDHTSTIGTSRWFDQTYKQPLPECGTSTIGDTERTFGHLKTAAQWRLTALEGFGAASKRVMRQMIERLV